MKKANEIGQKILNSLEIKIGELTKIPSGNFFCCESSGFGVAKFDKVELIWDLTYKSHRGECGGMIKFDEPYKLRFRGRRIDCDEKIKAKIYNLFKNKFNDLNEKTFNNELSTFCK